MEASPLTLQARPEHFQQKIVELYDELFQDDEDAEKSEGFWMEFFLLRPDPAALRRILAERSPDDLLQLQPQTQALFARALSHIKSGDSPSDEIALDTLTAFLGSILSKKYTNPSSDVINVIAGLDQVDATFAEFVNSLELLIRNGKNIFIRQKAIEVALAVISGAYQTSLVSYFTHRDLFPALMKFINDSDTSARAFEPFVLLGLLANYNKFEFRNPYRLRLEDFVNEGIIQKIVRSIGTTCTTVRDEYVAVFDDLPEGWNINSTLTYLGLGALAPGAKPAQPVPSPEAAKEQFAALPGPRVPILLATYDFAYANKLFCFNLVTAQGDSKNEESPISAYLSLTSYLLNHAHRTTRTALYAYLNILVIRTLIEDQVLCKVICGEEKKTSVRLCRQRQPYLPLIKSDRPIATIVLDMMIDGLNHNLRRRLDVDLYILCIGVLTRTISFLIRSRIRLAYHWSELWRSLLSLVRFLTSYSADLLPLPNITTFLEHLVNLIALALSAGDAFLPTPAAYDDLFYKLVETGTDTLAKFRDAYPDLAKSPQNSIATLISVSAHYYELLESSKSKNGRSSHPLSAAQVNSVIKSGYESLSITAKDGLDAWSRYREADERVLLKKVARIAVGDVRKLLSE